MTQLVRLQIKQGHVVQGCDVYIGRAMNQYAWGKLGEDNPARHTSKWANPFKGSNAVLEYYNWILLPEQAELIQEGRKELLGKTLGCWCLGKKGQLSCHGEVWQWLCDGVMPHDLSKVLLQNGISARWPSPSKLLPRLQKPATLQSMPVPINKISPVAGVRTSVRVSPKPFVITPKVSPVVVAAIAPKRNTLNPVSPVIAQAKQTTPLATHKVTVRRASPVESVQEYTFPSFRDTLEIEEDSDFVDIAKPYDYRQKKRQIRSKQEQILRNVEDYPNVTFELVKRLCIGIDTEFFTGRFEFLLNLSQATSDLKKGPCLRINLNDDITQATVHRARDGCVTLQIPRRVLESIHPTNVHRLRTFTRTLSSRCQALYEMLCNLLLRVALLTSAEAIVLDQTVNDARLKRLGKGIFRHKTLKIKLTIAAFEHESASKSLRVAPEGLTPEVKVFFDDGPDRLQGYCVFPILSKKILVLTTSGLYTVPLRMLSYV